MQLTCAYRLGRSDNLLEAYYGLSETETELLVRHHSHWDINLKYSLPRLDRLASAQTSATDADLQGENSHALRFAVKRCRLFNPNIVPVTVVGCGSRDAEKYGIGKTLVPPQRSNVS